MDFFSNGSFQLFGDSGLGGDVANSLGIFSNPLPFQDGERTQANGGSWEALVDNTMTSFSPARRSSMPTPYGQDIQETGMENFSPSTPQITSIPAYIPAPQSPHRDDFPIFDLNQDIDFSMYLNSPDRSSTASSSSRSGSNRRRSVERRSISPFQLPYHDDTYRDGGFGHVSKSTAAADQAPDPVTEEDREAELILSGLLLLKSLVFSHTNTVFQKYEYQKTSLSDLCCSDWCEWVSLELEELLDFYLQESLRSIRKRRIARVQSSLPSGCNFNLNDRRQGFECSDGPQLLSNPTEANVATKMRTIFFRCCFTPMGQIVFKVRKGPSSPIGEAGVDLNYLITISFLPRAIERTTGICVRSSRIMGGPAIPPQVRPLNVVPDDSAIIQCVRNNDLKGIQTLFDLGAASARDVDSRGISLLYVSTSHKYEQLMSLLNYLQYAMFTGCSDVFRLLLQGGASTNECDDYRERTTDIITAVWKGFVAACSGDRMNKALSMEKLKNFEECVAITQLALDKNCTIDGANDRVLAAGPLFALVGATSPAIDASTLVDAICYLLSIGWDLEEKNCYGQTPLLFLAAEFGPQIARCLRTFIDKGARLDAKDAIGRGPLLSALESPLDISDHSVLLCPKYVGKIDYDATWSLSHYFSTEDRRHLQDYYDTESVLDPLTSHMSPRSSQSTPSLHGIESSQLLRDQQSEPTAERVIPIDLAMPDLDSNASSCSEESILNSKDDDYVYCFNDDGDGIWIRNPCHVLKDRIRMKLKILLDAGCDPNEFDMYGDSTNDYAWRGGLWSQWLWALEKTGYVFDEEQNRWVKQINSA